MNMAIAMAAWLNIHCPAHAPGHHPLECSAAGRAARASGVKLRAAPAMPAAHVCEWPSRSTNSRTAKREGSSAAAAQKDIHVAVKRHTAQVTGHRSQGTGHRARLVGTSMQSLWPSALCISAEHGIKHIKHASMHAAGTCVAVQSILTKHTCEQNQSSGPPK